MAMLYPWLCFITCLWACYIQSCAIWTAVLYSRLWYTDSLYCIHVTEAMLPQNCRLHVHWFFWCFFFVKHNHTNATFCFSKDGIMEYADYTVWYRNCSTKCEKQFRSALCMIPKVILTTQGVPAPITAGYEKASWNVHIVISSKKHRLNGNATETFTGWNFGRKSN